MARILLNGLALLLLLLLSAPVAGTEEGAPAEAPALPKIEGSWILTIPMPSGVEKPTLKIRERDGNYKATLKGKRGSTRIRNFTIEGKSINFTQNIQTPAGEMELKFRGSVQGDRIQGVIELPMGVLPFAGSRRAY
jgi:hypothetical protein